MLELWFVLITFILVIFPMYLNYANRSSRSQKVIDNKSIILTLLLSYSIICLPSAFIISNMPKIDPSNNYVDIMLGFLFITSLAVVTLQTSYENKKFRTDDFSAAIWIIYYIIGSIPLLLQLAPIVVMYITPTYAEFAGGDRILPLPTAGIVVLIVSSWLFILSTMLYWVGVVASNNGAGAKRYFTTADDESINTNIDRFLGVIVSWALVPATLLLANTHAPDDLLPPQTGVLFVYTLISTSFIIGLLFRRYTTKSSHGWFVVTSIAFATFTAVVFLFGDIFAPIIGTEPVVSVVGPPAPDTGKEPQSPTGPISVDESTLITQIVAIFGLIALAIIVVWFTDTDE